MFRSVQNTVSDEQNAATTASDEQNAATRPEAVEKESEMQGASEQDIGKPEIGLPDGIGARLDALEKLINGLAEKIGEQQTQASRYQSQISKMVNAGLYGGSKDQGGETAFKAPESSGYQSLRTLDFMPDKKR